MRKTPIGKQEFDARQYGLINNTRMEGPVFIPELNEVHIGPVEIQKSRPPLEVTLKVVCADCNNGWMSRLEESVRPILTRLMADEAGVSLSDEDAARLRRWVLMVWAIYQFDQPASMVFSDEDLHCIMTGQGELSGVIDVWWGRSPDREKWFSLAHRGGHAEGIFEDHPGVRVRYGSVGHFALAAGMVTFLVRFDTTDIPGTFLSMDGLSAGVPHRVTANATWPPTDLAPEDWSSFLDGDCSVNRIRRPGPGGW